MAESINTETQLSSDPKSVAEMEKYGITKKSIDYYFHGEYPPFKDPDTPYKKIDKTIEIITVPKLADPTENQKM